jgi:two-component system, NtrC family, sensor kinase
MGALGYDEPLTIDSKRGLAYANLPVMMYMASAKGVIVDVNRFWLERLGYEREEVIGRRSVEFMPSGDSVDRQAVWAKLRAGEHVDSWSIQYLTSKGEIVDGLLFGAPIMGGDGELRGAIATVFDVTPLRTAERQRDRFEAELRLSQKLEAVGQLAAGIAHEINTPSQYVSDNLAFISESMQQLLPLLDVMPAALGNASAPSDQAMEEYRRLLAAADLDFVRAEIPAAIQQARDGVAQIKKIVRAMKEFSHPGGEDKEAVDFNRAIESTVLVARNEWKYVADLELALDPNLPPIQAVASQLNQVVLNLVVNAAHAIADAVAKSPGSKGKIRVATVARGDQVELSIADSGCGIPQQNLERIFEPFFTTKEVGKGTGQGLAIARRVVVEGHGGSIKVESEPGKGACFRISLPVGVAKAAGVAA